MCYLCARTKRQALILRHQEPQTQQPIDWRAYAEQSSEALALAKHYVPNNDYWKDL